jgi:uncharacterized DUF497 family protein
VINFDLIVGFEWDSGNHRKNELKHSVTSAEAEEVFFNSPLLISMDDKHSVSEHRYLALGQSNRARELAIIFTLRQGGILIRVISARNQHRKERKLYEQAKP